MNAHSTVKSGEVTLETTAKMVNNRLRIEYDIRNREKAAIYVFNKLYTKIDENRVWHVDPNRVYVLFSGGAGTLAKRVIAVPHGVLVEHREFPCVTRIEPGKSYHESISLVPPIVPWTPYSIDREGEHRTVKAEFSFEIGFFRERPGTSKLAYTVKTPRGTSLYFDSFNADNQSILKTRPFPFRVPFSVVGPGEDEEKAEKAR
jgi:hypothetical protein